MSPFPLHTEDLAEAGKGTQPILFAETSTKAPVNNQRPAQAALRYFRAEDRKSISLQLGMQEDVEFVRSYWTHHFEDGEMIGTIWNGDLIDEERPGWSKNCPRCGESFHFTVLNVIGGFTPFLYSDTSSDFVLRDDDVEELERLTGLEER